MGSERYCVVNWLNPRVKGVAGFNGARARTFFVARLFAASQVAAAAFVWIWRFVNPGQFGVDLFD
jgi:hypothetical protein